MASPVDGPLVTVYVVNRNYGPFLRQAVDSVLGQDYPHLEVIVIDDGSDDDSVAVLDRLEDQTAVRVIRLLSHRGLTACANLALRESHGEFVMRLDADDYLERSAVGAMVAEIASDPAAVLVFGDYVEVDSRGVPIRRVQRHDFNALDAMSDLPAHGACTLVRRSFLDSFGGYDETVDRQDGLDLWLHVSDGQRVLRIPEPLFSYRRHGGNLTADEGALLRARGRLLAKHVVERGLPRPRVIAIVPVRGPATDPGSRPLRHLGDRPLADWTIEAALQCHSIDRVVVTSPDSDVLGHVTERFGRHVGVHHRGADRAALNVDLAATRQDVLKAEALGGRRYDAEMTLTIEFPFRSAAFIEQAVDTLQLFDAGTVVGVRRDEEVFYHHNGFGLEPLRSDDRLRRERDDLFRECGGIRLVTLSGARTRMGHVLLDQYAALAVRTDLDWRIAQSLANSPVEGLDGSR